MTQQVKKEFQNRSYVRRNVERPAKTHAVLLTFRFFAGREECGTLIFADLNE